MFSKLNGDLVLVPVFHHRDYPLAVTIDTALKAQVTSSQNLSFTPQSYLVMEELWSSEAVAELSTDQRPSATGGQVRSDR